MNEAVSIAIGNSITVAQAFVIEYIATSNKDILQRDIEKEFDLNKSSVSLMLNNMSKNNLIERHPVSYDARLKKIVLTKKSLELYKKISEAITTIENKLSNNINKEEVNIFNTVLNKIRSNLE